jgi:hypothetical protein
LSDVSACRYFDLSLVACGSNSTQQAGAGIPGLTTLSCAASEKDESVTKDQ